MSNVHPSTKTKSMILNGSEITTGGSIIMPIAINTAETTMSMTKKTATKTKTTTFGGAAWARV